MAQLLQATYSEEYTYLLKFLIIGNTNTGKSCLLHRFMENKFKPTSSHTIGVEFGSKCITLSGKKVKLQIWDTAGQERFRAVTRSYYRGATGALLVYDIANRDSYVAVQHWLADARSLANSQISVLMVGNKSDLEEKRQVLFLEANKFAEDNDMTFIETSALSGENVEDAFLKCAKTILSKLDSGEIDVERVGPGIQVHNYQPIEKSKEKRKCGGLSCGK